MAERERQGNVISKSLKFKGTAVTSNGADLNLLTGRAAIGSTLKQVAKVALAAVDTAGGALSWQNPEAVAIVVNRITLDVTTIATSAGTISVGMTASSGTTSVANLIDTLDVHTATGTFDNLANPGSGGKMLQKVAVGKWVTGSKASGALAGLAGYAYIEYFLV